MDHAKRDFRMVQLREKGYTLEKIGKTYGMGREGARLIIANRKSLLEDLQRGGLRGHGLDTRSVRVLGVLLNTDQPCLDDLRTWLPANLDWRLLVYDARNGGVTTVRHIQEFAIQKRLLRRKPDGIHNTGVVLWLCAALERLTRIDNPTKDELRTWFAENPNWEDDCHGEEGTVTPDEASAIKKYAKRAGLVENPCEGLSVRAYNCMLLVCPDIRRTDFSTAKLQAWFAEHPLWLRQVTFSAACRVKTRKEISRFVDAQKLADRSKAPSEAVYTVLESLLHLNMTPCRDLSYNGLRAWFAANPDWHERLRRDHSYFGEKTIRAVEKYVRREKLAEPAEAAPARFQVRWRMIFNPDADSQP